MQKANHFTFVMLINMAPPDQIPQNITFLMPNDRTLSKTNMAETSILDFLLQHSIPSPLLIDHLQHFPTGSMIPTSRPGLMLKVTNDGRRSFFLNNVRIISPNICTKGFSIRCHGIDGVVQPTMIPQPNIPPTLTTCPNTSTSPPWVAAAPLPDPAPRPVAVLTAPPPSVSPTKSSSPRIILDLAMTFLMLSLWLFI
ncbi:hypothetical protein ACJIZ3_003422 [Penstemon smallii]|uniref:FAS1 domain-containing protein n=1 Tax=Penstemon smallii TaxID=265156 RepID=A0ABD3U975_9LAMI